jgi:hypothetical protein
MRRSTPLRVAADRRRPLWGNQTDSRDITAAPAQLEAGVTVSRSRTSDPIPGFIHLLRAKDLIDRRYAEPLDVPTLAREACASQAHFARSFKRAFSETPHRYLARRSQRGRAPSGRPGHGSWCGRGAA